MFLVDAAKLHALRLCVQFDLDLHRGGRGALPCKVVQVLFGSQHGKLCVGSIAERCYTHLAVQCAGQLQPFIPGLPQQAQCVEKRFCDTVLGHKTIPAVKFLREGMNFLKNIAEAPDAGSVDEILSTESRAHIVGGYLTGIVTGRAKGCAAVPFGIVYRQTVSLLLYLLGGIAQQITIQVIRLGVVGHRAAEHGQQAILRL